MLANIHSLSPSFMTMCSNPLPNSKGVSNLESHCKLLMFILRKAPSLPRAYLS